jgi:hypothetical protein
VLGLTVPLFAAVASFYAQGGYELAPRLMLLDEAFAGIDDAARAHCMGLIRAFDLGFVITSEREWACYAELPGVSICQLQRREGVDEVYVSPYLLVAASTLGDFCAFEFMECAGISGGYYCCENPKCAKFGPGTKTVYEEVGGRPRKYCNEACEKVHSRLKAKAASPLRQIVAYGTCRNSAGAPWRRAERARRVEAAKVAARSPPAATRCASRGGEGLQAVGRTMRRRRSAGAMSNSTTAAASALRCSWRQ